MKTIASGISNNNAAIHQEAEEHPAIRARLFLASFLCLLPGKGFRIFLLCGTMWDFYEYIRIIQAHTKHDAHSAVCTRLTSTVLEFIICLCNSFLFECESYIQADKTECGTRTCQYSTGRTFSCEYVNVFFRFSSSPFSVQGFRRYFLRFLF